MAKRGLIAKAFPAVLILHSILACDVHASEIRPKRIISLAPSITEEIYLLGVQDSLVGNTTYCVTPPAARSKEKVGTITQLDLEKAVGLKPDLVLATSLTNPKTVQKLRDLGIEVKIFPAPKDFASLCGQFLDLGKAIGKEAEARAIISASEADVAAIKTTTAALVKPKIFIEIGNKPLFTANRDYFINDFVTLAGGENIAEDAKIGTYSREEVLKRNADVILIVTMGLTGEKEKETWQKFATLNAVKHNRIYVLDSRKVCSPTPVSFVTTLKEIAALLHPELQAGEK